MKQSILPEHLERDTIGRMSPGDKGYTVSWAMQADPDRRLYIRGDYSVSPVSRGTMHMAIERTTDGVIVDQRSIQADDKWDVCGPLDPAWLPLPVELR